MSTTNENVEKSINQLTIGGLDKDSGGTSIQFFVKQISSNSESNEWDSTIATKAGFAFSDACSKWKNDFDSYYQSKISELQQKADSYHSEQQSYVNEANSYVKKVKVSGDNFKPGDNAAGESSGFAFGGTQYKNVITNRPAYNVAVQNANEAERKYKQAESELSNAKRELGKLEDKLDGFVKEFYSIPLMNENKDFLSYIISAEVVSSSDFVKELKGQLFYITNVYRKNYDEIAKLLEDNKEKFLNTWTHKLPEKLNFGASVQVIFEKIKTNLDIAFTSTDTASINCNYLLKKEFVFKKKSIEAAIVKLNEAKKDFDIVNEGKLVIVQLDKKIENDAAIAEISVCLAKLEDYKNDAEMLFKMCKENGASTSKLTVVFTKMGNSITRLKNKITGFFNKGKKKPAEEQKEIEADTASQE